MLLRFLLYQGIGFSHQIFFLLPLVNLIKLFFRLSNKLERFSRKKSHLRYVEAYLSGALKL
jgi:hypothetical protein